jgi:hypothetical protein
MEQLVLQAWCHSSRKKGFGAGQRIHFNAADTDVTVSPVVDISIL